LIRYAFNFIPAGSYKKRTSSHIDRALSYLVSAHATHRPISFSSRAQGTRATYEDVTETKRGPLEEIQRQLDTA
jgi:hypothetical protein